MIVGEFRGPVMLAEERTVEPNQVDECWTDMLSSTLSSTEPSTQLVMIVEASLGEAIDRSGAGSRVRRC